MYFTGPYLRVTTPKTTNGIVPKMNNGQQEVTETFLPLSARKQLESKNRRLLKNGYQHLVAEIEVVGGTTPASAVQETPKRKTKLK